MNRLVKWYFENISSVCLDHDEITLGTILERDWHLFVAYPLFFIAAIFIAFIDIEAFMGLLGIIGIALVVYWIIIEILKSISNRWIFKTVIAVKEDFKDEE